MLLYRAVGRLGLLWQILIPSTLAVVLCVAAVQFWTLRVSQGALEERAHLNLEASLALLKAYLTPLGTEWSRKGGQLQLGAAPIAGRDDVVDQAAEAAGGVATIFSGDERVATNVRKTDGTRALGTKLADPIVREAVLQQGRTYDGKATILGRQYLTLYEPIRNKADEVVGILFTGMPTTELEKAKAAVVREAVLAGGASVLLFMLVWARLLVLILCPLNGLAAATRRIVGGDLEGEVPSTTRSDQVGAMAVAIQVFRAAAVDKQRVEAEATEARRVAEAERARNEAERGAVAEQQAVVVKGIATGLERLADGDLVFRLQEPFASDYETLRTDFNAAMGKLQNTMGVIAGNALAIRAGTAEIATAADDLSRRTEQQAASLEETAAALDEITATVHKTAEGATHARTVVSTAKSDAEQSSLVVGRAVEAMVGIETSSKQIGQIIGVIDEIAFQTNLLALNAGVEAARAGEAGRGFAVVASEVRALAQRSAEAAKEIKVLISASAQHVGSGVQLVGETGKSLQRIVTQVIEIDAVVTDIAASAHEQSAGLNQVNVAINQMDQVTQQNAAMVEQSTAASKSLAHETEELAGLVGRFKVDTVGASDVARQQIAQTRPAVVRASGKPTVSSRAASTKKLVVNGVPVSTGRADEWQDF